LITLRANKRPATMANNATLDSHLAAVSRNQGRIHIGIKKPLKSKPSVNILATGEGMPIVTSAAAAQILASVWGPRTGVLCAGVACLVLSQGSEKLCGAFSMDSVAQLNIASGITAVKRPSRNIVAF
jgi:hypothetical protein